MILGSIFQKGAVFQRDMDIPVWGRTLPEKKVQAFFDGVKIQTVSSADGYFICYLPPHEAGRGLELTVQVAGNDEEKVTISDILVGEVWLASGQSNMAYKLGSDWRVNCDVPADKTLGRIQERQFNEMVMNPDEFRIFTVAERASIVKEDHCAGSWVNMDKFHSSNASAVAAWFGLGLQYQLDIPIGIIDASWGGTMAETWMSMEALWACPETRQAAAEMQKLCQLEAPWDGSGTAAYENNPDVHADPGNTGVGMGYADVEFDDSSWQDMIVGGSWIRQNIAGNGIVWLRSTVDIPASWENCEITLYGGEVDKQDISYVNGVEVGRIGKGFETCHYNTPRCYPVPAGVVKAGKAVVAIRAYSFAYDGAVTGKWFLANNTTGEFLELGSIWKAKAEYDWGVVKFPALPAAKYGLRTPTSTPTMMFNGMINPLLPMALRGVIWYQGESNAHTIEEARAYREIMPALIDDWRLRLRNPQMPFIMVQLAGFNTTSEADAWAELREAQRLIANNDPDTWMISAVDAGDENDIHPENKLDVGKRLAMCALHNVYGYEEIIPSGPEVEKAETCGNGVKIFFKYNEKLQLKGEDKSFLLAGADGVFYTADKMEIDEDNNVLLLSSSEMSGEVCRVRYAWSNCPAVVLFNGAGFPASPFDIQLD